jgi:hypothetical protein
VTVIADGSSRRSELGSHCPGQPLTRRQMTIFRAKALGTGRTDVSRRKSRLIEKHGHLLAGCTAGQWTKGDRR